MTLSMFTDEDLKEELYNRGYCVSKKPYRPKRDPCVCGRKIIDFCSDWSSGNRMLFFRCPKCGLRSEPAETRSGAIDNWNELVRKRKEG